MAVATATELDPVFLKALKLLHSRHPDSAEQLKALRDEAIRQQSHPGTSPVQVLMVMYCLKTIFDIISDHNSVFI